MMKLFAFTLIPFLAFQTQLAFANSLHQSTLVEEQNGKRVSYSHFQGHEPSEYRATTLYSQISKMKYDEFQQTLDSLSIIEQSLVPSEDDYVLKIDQDKYNERLQWAIRFISGLKVTKTQLKEGITLSQRKGTLYRQRLEQYSEATAAKMRPDRYRVFLTHTTTGTPSIAIQWPGYCRPDTMPERSDVLVNDVTVKMKISCDSEHLMTTVPESPKALQQLKKSFSREAWVTMKFPQKKDEVKFWTVNFQESWDALTR